jgi:hypothetical protein
METVKTDKIADAPYYERQLITIVPDEVKEAERKADEKIDEAATNKKSKSADYVEVVRNILEISAKPQQLIANVVIQLGVEAIKAVKDLYSKGIEILTISSTESSKFLFPPGHPRRKILYVGHPASANVYFPFTDFHRQMFESKFSEAVTMLMALGAETLNIERLEGWGYEMSSELSLPIPNAPESNVGLDASSNKNKNNSLLFSASLKPNHKAIIPKDLVWYNYEPTWKMVSDGRLNYGLNEFSLNVSYKDDYGIGAKLKGEIEKAGFEVGSNFTKHTATVWNISGKFSTKRAERI